MTGLAGRSAGVTLDAVLGGKNRQNRFDFALIMTLGAYRIPLQVIGGCRVSFSFQLRWWRFAYIREVGSQCVRNRP